MFSMEQKIEIVFDPQRTDYIEGRIQNMYLQWDSRKRWSRPLTVGPVENTPHILKNEIK